MEEDKTSFVEAAMGGEGHSPEPPVEPGQYLPLRLPLPHERPAAYCHDRGQGELPGAVF